MRVKTMNNDLDEYEQDILDSVESDEWQSKENIQQRQVELQHFLRNETKQELASSYSLT